EVGVMRFLPGVRDIAVLGGRHVGTAMHPGVPAGGDGSGIGGSVIGDPAAPAPLAFLPVAVAEFVLADEVEAERQPEARAPGLAVPPDEDLREEVSDTVSFHAAIPGAGSRWSGSAGL